uniref:Orphan protein n=1 Tax=Globodera pallida TaxID=36090 RepID=A0A183C4Y7_GLOPA
MAIYSYSIVFYCFLFFSTRVFLAESSVEQQSHSTMTANSFMEMLLTKMVAELLHIPILHQSEQNVLLDQQLSNLTPEQNLATYWFDIKEHFDVTISSHKSENIFGLKLAVNIDTLILMKNVGKICGIRLITRKNSKIAQII